MVPIKPIRKLLIANRGEIATRIVDECAHLKIRTVAVYSDADRRALHVKDADEAIHIGSAPASESYLRIDRIIDAARRTGADAIHPGYGFLSENADFAEACIAAGITFVGPSPDVIRKMGSKTAARQIAQEAGVPILPGAEAGFPVLVKAAAGGGGKGMRRVNRADDLNAAMEAAAREAQSSFGDPALLIEKYIERARHIEVQILGDLHGNLIHLFERECSIQRRYQKIIEEAPSPALTPELRERITAAALRIGRAVNYTNAGTVEFLLAQPSDGKEAEFYFIEVNARIQVEYRVTEKIAGTDLIRAQLEIAEGRANLPNQDKLSIYGHAIEARLYAENPANGFLPSTGRVLGYSTPRWYVQIDEAVDVGDEVGIQYDPMLAKVFTHSAEGRDDAVLQLRNSLESVILQGPITNRLHLLHLISHPAFLAGELHTGFVDEAGPVPSSTDDKICVAVLAMWIAERNRRSATPLANITPNYRNNPWRDPSARFTKDGRVYEACYRLHGDAYEVTVDSETYMVRWTGEVVVDCEAHTKRWTGAHRLEVDGRQSDFFIANDGDLYIIDTATSGHRFTRISRYPQSESGASRETANSPMPGQVLRILVEPGNEVRPGDPLLVLEAMKMEQTIRATIHGRVGPVLVRIGQVVSPGQMLVEIGPLESSGAGPPAGVLSKKPNETTQETT